MLKDQSSVFQAAVELYKPGAGLRHGLGIAHQLLCASRGSTMDTGAKEAIATVDGIEYDMDEDAIPEVPVDESDVDESIPGVETVDGETESLGSAEVEHEVKVAADSVVPEFATDEKHEATQELLHLRAEVCRLTDAERNFVQAKRELARLLRAAIKLQTQEGALRRIDQAATELGRRHTRAGIMKKASKMLESEAEKESKLMPPEISKEVDEMMKAIFPSREVALSTVDLQERGLKVNALVAELCPVQKGTFTAVSPMLLQITLLSVNYPLYCLSTFIRWLLFNYSKTCIRMRRCTQIQSAS